MILNDQLETYIIDIHSSSEFSELKGISDLAQKIVEIKRHIVYPLVTLALVLPVATRTVERTFYVMNIVKNRRRNRIRNQWMKDHLLVYIEKYIFDIINNEIIIQHF